MGEKGWGAPTWPQAYGGGGLRPPQARVLQQEMDRIGAYNPIGGMGVMMFGPTLLEYGNEEQKQEHIPPIVSGEVRWCQGYLRAGRRLRPRRRCRPRRGQGRPLPRQRPEDLDQRRAIRRLVLLPGAHRHTKKHEGISLPADRHEVSRASKCGRSS